MITVRKLLSRVSIGVVITCVITSGAAAQFSQEEDDPNLPSQSLPSLGKTDFERYGNVVTKDVINNAIGNMGGVEIGVREATERIKSEYDAAEGATAEEKVANWSATSSRWDNFRGATESVIQDANSTHSGNAIAAFESCQPPYSHTYLMTLLPSVSTETNVHAMVWNTVLESMDMAVNYDGYLGALTGQENVVGFAARCDINPAVAVTGIICICQTADVIEYYFPVQKLNLSEQMWQSSLISKDDVAGMADAAKEIDRVVPSTMRNLLTTARNKAHMNIALGGTRVKVDKSGDVNIQPKSQEAYDALEEVRKKYKQFDHTALAKDVVYSRVFAEGVNFLNLFMGDLPHNIIMPRFGTDFPLGYSYSKLFQYSSRWSKQWNAFLRPGGEFSCVRNNVASRKTPRFPLRDLIGSLGRQQISAVDALTRGEKETNERCLEDIGEVHTVMASMRRPAITDMSWAGLQKGMEVYQKAVTMTLTFGPIATGKYTYIKNLDKWHVVSDGDLRRETPQCDILDKVTRKNIEYREANIKRIGTGAENTVGSFVRLKGAFAHRGHDVPWFISGSCGGFMEDFGETAFSGEFRLD